MTPAQIKEMEELAAKYAATDANLYEPRYVLEEKTQRKAFAYVDGYTSAMKKAEALVKALEKLIPDKGVHLYGSEELRLIVKQWRGE